MSSPTHFFPTYCRWSEPFISKRIKLGGDPRVLGNFVKCSNEWIIRIQKEKDKMEKSVEVEGKSKL